MRYVIATCMVLLFGCSAFSSPGKLVEYHNRAAHDQQIEKWSRGDVRGGQAPTVGVWDNR